MTAKELNEIVVEKHNKTNRYKKVNDLTEIPIARAIRIGLTDTEFQEYLDIYATIAPFEFAAAIINSTILPEELISFLKNYPRQIKNVPYTLYVKRPNLLKDLILNNPGTFKLEMLPSFMARDIEFQHIVKESWKDVDNLDGETPINTLDYKELAEEYYNSHMSINVFCAKHKIDNETHFRQYIKKLETENPMTEEEENKIKKELAVIGKRIITGELSLEDYLKYYYHPSHTVNLFQAALGSKADKFNKVFALQIYNYLFSDNRNVDAEKITTLFGKSFDYSSVGYSKLSGKNEMGTILKNYIFSNTDKRDLYNIPKIFKAYSAHYNTSVLLGTRIFNGVSYEIDEETIEQTLSYMAENEIFINQKSLNYYIELIVTGAVTPKRKQIEK